MARRAGPTRIALPAAASGAELPNRVVIAAAAAGVSGGTDTTPRPSRARPSPASGQHCVPRTLQRSPRRFEPGPAGLLPRRQASQCPLSQQAYLPKISRIWRCTE